MDRLNGMYSRAPTATKPTRDCLDPWFFAQIAAERDVKPCCVRPPIGVLAKGVSIDDVLNGPEIRELRRQLLTGELDAYCASCPTRPLTDPASLRMRVRQEIAQEIATDGAAGSR